MRSVVFTSMFALIMTSSLAVDALALSAPPSPPPMRVGSVSTTSATTTSAAKAPAATSTGARSVAQSVSQSVAQSSAQPAQSGAKTASTAASPVATKEATASSAPGMRTVNNKDLKSLKTLNEKYQTSPLVSMDVAKTLKLGLLDQERKSKGKVHLSKGQMRMELEGAERSLLIVNKKNLWAVTFPPAEFKDAAVQVIRGDTTSKKARSQALTGLLASGGFLKHFKPTAVQTEANGEMVYFLQPLVATSEFKRAQLRVSKDVKQINELRYWDEKDNETRFEFSSVTFGKKADAKLFDYKPPANADIMNL